VRWVVIACDRLDFSRSTLTQVQPYLFFEGRCEEAVELYRKALGAEVEMMLRMKDSPEKPPPAMVPPGSDNKVVRSLKAKGVTFEHYDMPDMKLVGDVHVTGATKVAWFKDPDGNILNIVNG
jgi:uncharacterized glyoxalase superfamily protein PhnB